MHQRANESDIIIVNHHLFFADLAVKAAFDGAAVGGIIPDYGAVIFDEAHEVEDVAGQYFGVSVSTYQFDDLVRDVMALAHRKNFGSKELDRFLITLSDRSVRFFALFGANEGRTGFRSHDAFLEANSELYQDVLAALEIVALQLELLRAAPEEVIPLVYRARELARRLQFWMERGKGKPLAASTDPETAGDAAAAPVAKPGTDRAYVYWIERRGRGTFLQATPIDVSVLLDEKLFDVVDTVILTQALLYVPQTLPDPRSPAFSAAAAQEIVEILMLSRGRAFVLFTSYQQMRLIYDRVSLEIPYETLLQGTGPRMALLEEFRSTKNAVLFATASFWQGVDVPGEQLSCVIIDKLPFAVPSDPVVEARIAAIRDEGGDAFQSYQVPQAAIALKQGFGRLIRSRSDRGVLALLDQRITRTRYGQIFFDSLPPYGFTTRREDVEKFFKHV